MRRLGYKSAPKQPRRNCKLFHDAEKEKEKETDRAKKQRAAP